MGIKRSLKFIAQDLFNSLRLLWRQVTIFVLLTMVQCEETQIQTASTVADTLLYTTPSVATIAQVEYDNDNIQLFEMQIQPDGVLTNMQDAMMSISTGYQFDKSRSVETQVEPNDVVTLSTSTAQLAEKFTRLYVRTKVDENNSSSLNVTVSARIRKSEFNGKRFLETQVQPNKIVAATSSTKTLLAAIAKYGSGSFETQIQPNVATSTNKQAFRKDNYLDTQVEPNVAATSSPSSLLVATTTRQTGYDNQFLETQIQPNVAATFMDSASSNSSTNRLAENNDNQYKDMQIKSDVDATSTPMPAQYDCKILNIRAKNILLDVTAILKTIIRRMSGTVQAVIRKSTSSRGEQNTSF